jgi:hypothetical protein
MRMGNIAGDSLSTQSACTWVGPPNIIRNGLSQNLSYFLFSNLPCLVLRREGAEAPSHPVATRFVGACGCRRSDGVGKLPGDPPPSPFSYFPVSLLSGSRGGGSSWRASCGASELPRRAPTTVEQGGAPASSSLQRGRRPASNR